MKKVETLTLNEAMDVFRGYGVSMSYETICSIVDEGKVPWAISAKSETSGNQLRKIFRKPLIEWLESMAEEDEAV